MAVILLFVAAIFVGGIFAFHFLLLGKGRLALSEHQWEAVDYIWYTLAFLGLAIGGFQIMASISRTNHSELIQKVESRYFQVEQLVSIAITRHCPNDPGQCQLFQDIRQAIRETQFTSGWPLAPIRFKGMVFDSLNLLIRERARELNVSAIDGSIEMMSTSALELVGEARKSEQNVSQITAPLWLTVFMSCICGAHNRAADYKGYIQGPSKEEAFVAGDVTVIVQPNLSARDDRHQRRPKDRGIISSKGNWQLTVLNCEQKPLNLRCRCRRANVHLSADGTTGGG